MARAQAILLQRARAAVGSITDAAQPLLPECQCRDAMTASSEDVLQQRVNTAERMAQYAAQQPLQENSPWTDLVTHVTGPTFDGHTAQQRQLLHQLQRGGAGPADEETWARRLDSQGFKGTWEDLPRQYMPAQALLVRLDPGATLPDDCVELPLGRKQRRRLSLRRLSGHDCDGRQLRMMMPRELGGTEEASLPAGVQVLGSLVVLVARPEWAATTALYTLVHPAFLSGIRPRKDTDKSASMRGGCVGHMGQLDLDYAMMTQGLPAESTGRFTRLQGSLAALGEICQIAFTMATTWPGLLWPLHFQVFTRMAGEVGRDGRVQGRGHAGADGQWANYPSWPQFVLLLQLRHRALPWSDAAWVDGRAQLTGEARTACVMVPTDVWGQWRRVWKPLERVLVEVIRQGHPGVVRGYCTIRNRVLSDILHVANLAGLCEMTVHRWALGEVVLCDGTRQLCLRLLVR